MTSLDLRFHIVFWSDSQSDFDYLATELNSIDKWTLTHVTSHEEMIAQLQNDLVSFLVIDLQNERLLKENEIDLPDGPTQIILISNEPEIKASNDYPIVNLKRLAGLLNVFSNAKYLQNAGPNESLFRTLLENVTDFIFFKNSDCKYVTVNQAFSNHFKIPISEIIGKSDAQLFSKEINIISSESDRYVIEQKKSILYETAYVNSNESRVFLETVKTPVFKSDMRVIGIVGVSRDITAKKLQEEHNRHQTLLLNQSEQLTNSGSFEVRQNDSYIKTSSNLISITELVPNIRYQLKNLEELVHPSDREQFINTFKLLPKTKRQSSVEHRIITKKTKRTIYCRTNFTIDFVGESWVVFGTLVDIGNERSNHQAILDAQENERKTLAADLHDSLIQKLVAANMYITSLEDDLTSTSKQSIAKELIQSAIDETRRLSRNLSLRTIENLGLKNALLEIVESLPLKAEVLYEFEFKEDQISLELATQIYRIFQEGIANVMKYANANKIWLTLHENTNGLLLKIHDDGIGFSPELVKDRNGLKNMRQRVNQINGIIDLSSIPNKGTQITIKIPLK